MSDTTTLTDMSISAREARMAEDPPLLIERISDQWTDSNQHMNVTGYMHYFDAAAWAFFDSIGLPPDVAKVQDRSFFALQHQLTYLAERRAGDLIALHIRLMTVARRRLHFYVAMSDPESGDLIATQEVIALFVSLSTRKAAMIEGTVRERLEEKARQDQAIPRPAPIGRLIGLDVDKKKKASGQ